MDGVSEQKIVNGYLFLVGFRYQRFRVGYSEVLSFFGFVFVLWRFVFCCCGLRGFIRFVFFRRVGWRVVEFASFYIVYFIYCTGFGRFFDFFVFVEIFSTFLRYVLLQSNVGSGEFQRRVWFGFRWRNKWIEGCVQGCFFSVCRFFVFFW